LVINGKTNVKYAYYLFLPFCLTRFWCCDYVW
jgi:hypothetical protein